MARQGNTRQSTATVDQWISANSRSIDVPTSKTLGLSDRNTRQVFSGASAGTITIPLDSAVAFPNGTEIEVTQENAGQVTIAVAAGVNLKRNGGILVSSVTITEQYGSLLIVKAGVNEWRLFGLSSGVQWADVSSKPNTIAGYGITNSILQKRSDQTTAPTSPAIGDLWTERDGTGAIVHTWEWDGADWLGQQIIHNPAGEGSITATLTTFMKVVNPGFSTGVKVSRFLLVMNNAGTHTSTARYTFQPSWANINGIGTNIGAAVTSDVTPANTPTSIAINQKFTHVTLAYFSITATRTTNAASMGFNCSVVGRYYR